MPRDLSFRGQEALVVLAGGDPTASVHALVRDGAHVTITGEAPTTSLLDLVQRGIVALAPEADPAAYDVVITARPAGSAHSTGAGAAGSAPSTEGEVGSVTLLGGGPGDPDLLTLAGLEALRTADVIVHDRLAPLESLVHARPDAQIIDVGKIPRGDFTPQERINAVLLEHALAGENVLRFKGGDNFVFGRGGEEAQACVEAGIPVRVIPGVSSSTAAPALAGIPVTHRSLVQGFTVVSGHVPPGDPRSTVDWDALARSGTTLVILMGVANLPHIAEALLESGLSEDTPAAVIADAGLPSMRTVRARLADIASVASGAGIGAPAVIVVGYVAALDVLG